MGQTSAGIPTFRTLEEAALAQWKEEHLEGGSKDRARVEKIWLGEELPASALVIIRHRGWQNPFPQFSFYRVDKSSLQCWRIEDAARRERLLQETSGESENSEETIPKN